MSTQPARGFDLKVARRSLARRDRRLASAFREVGPAEPPSSWTDPFESVDALCRSIIFQQLSGKAAGTIAGRVQMAAGGGSLLRAEQLQKIPDEALRNCGLSRAKLAAIRDVVERHEQGLVPGASKLEGLSNDEIRTILMPIRGIGPWSVEMLLIFRLGRPDIVSAGDLGLRRGLMLMDGAAAMPSANELSDRAKEWSPWGTAVSLALWRLADSRRVGAPVPRSQVA